MIGSKVHESFTGFVEMDSLSAESISTSILPHLSKIEEDFQKLVGQGYDGASTMAGHLSGVQKRIRHKYPRAIFVHCASHCLNLVINDQSKVPIIRNTSAVLGRQSISSESAQKTCKLGNYHSFVLAYQVVREVQVRASESSNATSSAYLMLLVF